MNTISAYKCQYTGKIFECPTDAARCEFRALMRRVPGHLPAPASNGWSVTEWFDWLTSEMSNGIYPSVFPALMEAATYFQENRKLIEGR